MDLSWVVPSKESLNGVLLGYQIHCTGQDDDIISVVVTGTAASLHNIHNDTYYTCTVCAYTSAGCGPVAVTHISTYENCKYCLLFIHSII